MIGPVNSWSVAPSGTQLAYSKAPAVVAARSVAQSSSPDTLQLSPEARATASASKQRATQGTSKSQLGDVQCETCRDRQYADGSDDPTVSFQSAQSIAPSAVASAVRAHESEHVRNEQVKAGQSGRKIVSQSVALHTSVCPECGRTYVSGGTTTTTTVAKASTNQDSAAQARKYGRLDAVA